MPSRTVCFSPGSGLSHLLGWLFFGNFTEFYSLDGFSAHVPTTSMWPFIFEEMKPLIEIFL